MEAYTSNIGLLTYLLTYVLISPHYALESHWKLVPGLLACFLHTWVPTQGQNKYLSQKKSFSLCLQWTWVCSGEDSYSGGSDSETSDHNKTSSASPSSSASASPTAELHKYKFDHLDTYSIRKEEVNSYLKLLMKRLNIFPRSTHWLTDSLTHSSVRIMHL